MKAWPERADSLHHWPTALQNYLSARDHTPTHIEPLQGLSGQRVWRVTFPAVTLIVKAALPREAAFYRDSAPTLGAQGVPVPALIWCTRANEQDWLVLEQIAHALPRERWLADRELLRVLHALHQAELSNPPSDTYRPQWSASMNRAALEVLGAMQWHDSLEAWRRGSQYLFAGDCWISGDPNPRNWGMRDDGTLVLFDWERFARGTPALDLAITVPGLGEWQDYARVAHTYLALGAAAESNDCTAQTMSLAIARAKVWSVVELLSNARAISASDARVVQWLSENVPPWLERMAVILAV